MKNVESALRQRELAILVALILGLGGCGGGGGNTKPNLPPTVPNAPPPSAPDNQPPLDAQLSITHAYAAHDLGYVGAGVTIGVVDSGIMRNHPALAGRVKQELIYVDPDSNNTAIDDVVGHGTWVSQIAAGRAFDQFPGGIAPGASLVSARIISDTEPKDDGSGQGNAVTADDAQFFAQTLNPALIDAGVRVMNNSWGGIYWDTTDPGINQAFAQAYEPFVTQHDGLVVFSAGNDSASEPSDIAALPSLAPQLEAGWLVAVAVDSNRPTQLASYSNACGKAMNYCLAAPGDVIITDKDAVAGSTPSYWVVHGTSFSAPAVSGAAAVVWQAFPYFDNDMVRQTLLGTADDLGAQGVDPVFGYGELDVGRAVRGPARFDWGDVSVTLNGYASTWSNDISGDGGLTVSGTGQLNLGGDNTYKGVTSVLGGTLTSGYVPGAAAIGPAGTLELTASRLGNGIDGSLVNNGNLVSRGGVISGDYTQGASGQLSTYLGAALTVTGTASIAGQLNVVGVVDGYVVNSHTDVITSHGLTGTFDALKTAPSVLLTASLNYDADSAWLDVSQVSVSNVSGMTYSAASYGSAQRVQSAFDQVNVQLGSGGVTATPIAGTFVDGAAALQHSASLGSLQQSLQSLSGQLHAASAAMTFQAIDAGTRALSHRFEQLLDAPAAGGWTQRLGYQGDMSRNGYSRVGYDLSGVLVGADQRIGSNGIAGYALSRSQGLGRLEESADQGHSHALEAMLYGGVVRNAWYAMGHFGVGNYRETMRRRVELGAQSDGLGSDDNGRYGVAYVESGYRHVLGRTAITPYFNLQYAQVQRDGFNEVGAHGFGLKSAAQTTARWQAGAGLRASREWSLPGAGSLSLQGHALWQQSFGLRGEVFNASFSGIDQFAPLGGIGLSRYGGVFGTALDWQMTPRASLQFSYDHYTGQRQQAQMATANFSWRF